MKKIYASFSLLIIALFTSCSISNYPQGSTAQSSDITYQQFYDDLSPYGQWVNYQDYGYVWVPDEQGFRPYYNNGHWIYTDYGWTWVSDYNWGWAPFHYGRWLYDDAYGWMWMPGYQWAPAWVSWRSGGDYYGWAPLGPDANINTNYGSNIPYNNWSFVPSRYITSPVINNYYVNSQQNVTIINNTTVINNTRVINNNNVYITGPSADEVEKNTHEKINAIRIVQRNNPGNAEVSGNNVSMYRPGVKDAGQQTQNVRPSRIGNLNDVKTRHERPATENTGSRKELNPTDRVQPGVKTEQNNTPPVIIHQREPGQPQNTTDDQKVPPDPANKKDNSTPGNERLNRHKEDQQPDQQPDKNPPVQKPQPTDQNTDKKNSESNNQRFPNQNNNQNNNNNQQQPGTNNSPSKVPNKNQSNNNPANRPVIKTPQNNMRPQNNNTPPVQKNLPGNKAPVDNHLQQIKKDNPKVILQKRDTAR